MLSQSAEKDHETESRIVPSTGPILTLSCGLQGKRLTMPVRILRQAAIKQLLKAIPGNPQVQPNSRVPRLLHKERILYG